MRETLLNTLLNSFLNSVVNPVLCVVILLVLLAGLKIWLDRATFYDDDELIRENGNLAITLYRVGIYLALVIAVTGSLNRTRYELLPDISLFALDGVVTLILLIACSYANDRLILHEDPNHLELQKGNKAVGILEAAAFIATGNILAGAFSGDGGGIASAIVFTALGQFALVLLSWLHNRRSPVDFDASVRQSNLASAFVMGGELVALGIVLRASISGPFVSWTSDLLSFSASLGAALLFLWVTRWLIDWLFLPKTSFAVQMERGNLAVGALFGGLNVGAALAVAAVI